MMNIPWQRNNEEVTKRETLVYKFLKQDHGT